MQTFLWTYNNRNNVSLLSSRILRPWLGNIVDSGMALYTIRPKARGLVQHGGPPGWLGAGDTAGSDFCVMWWTVHAACPDGPHPLCGVPVWGWLLIVHKSPSWATSRKEDMAWYASRPMPSLWSYWPARVQRLAGLYNNPMPESAIYSPVGD